MTKHLERTFEDEVVEYLTGQGWLLGTSAGYERALALYPEDALAWLEATQPTELAKVQRLHPMMLRRWRCVAWPRRWTSMARCRCCGAGLSISMRALRCASSSQRKG